MTDDNATDSDGTVARDPTGAGVDAPDFGSLAWLRRASGDTRLGSWRLTPERLSAYAAGVRALARAGYAVTEDDLAAVFDVDRQPLLRPWELPVGAPDPVAALAAEVEARPTLVAALRPAVAPADFAAAQVKLGVCLRALALLAGDEALGVDPGRLRAWADAQEPRPGAEADFAASLFTAVEGQDEVEAAFDG